MTAEISSLKILSIAPLLLEVVSKKLKKDSSRSFVTKTTGYVYNKKTPSFDIANILFCDNEGIQFLSSSYNPAILTH